MKMNFKYYLHILVLLFLSCEQNNTIATIDCAGVIGGLFEIDDCGDCSDPFSTNWNSNCTDCSGILNGYAYYDSCGQCICNPSDYPSGPPAGSLCFYPIECEDINNPGCSDGIASYTNNESFYIGADINGNLINGNFNNSVFYSIPCVLDCNAVLGGNAYLDNCNRCVSENEYPSVDSDQDGECDGIDSNLDGICDVCTGNAQPHSECSTSDVGQCVCYGNNCDECIDYNIDHCGECNGDGVDIDYRDKTKDECDILNGVWHEIDSWTGEDGEIYAPCGDDLCDGSDADNNGFCDRDQNNLCDGEDTCLWDDFVPYEDNCGECNGLIDECGVCNGNGIDSDQDGLCDNLDLDEDGLIDDNCTNGSGIVDECGVCDGDGIPENACDCNNNTLDCLNVCGGAAIIDDCGQCSGYYISANNYVFPKVDSDNDGICDGTDADGDGNCDTDSFGNCDGEDDCIDIDNDGLCYNNDSCPNDSNNDADNDGVCGNVDQCEGYNDNLDDDSDGIANGCDSCEGFDDNADTDADGTADGCDICPNDADDDADNDGLCGDVDSCPLDADNDADGDGVCGDVDQCEGFDDNLDTDQDGTADGCDMCQDFDDNIDADSDGTANGCDICPNDANDDADGDGICGDIDQCEGYDDNLDSDADSIPDDCDLDNDNDGTPDDEDCDPADNTKSEIDCNNECGGSSVIDANGTCCIGGTIDSCNLCYYSGFDENNTPFIFYQSVDSDNDNICDGVDVDMDGNCDICTDIGVPHAQCTSNDINQCVCYGNECDMCIGNNFDECGVCNGAGVDVDQDSICDDEDDCIGVFDVCGICNGNGTDIDNDGLCDNFDTDGDGNIDDSCIDTDNDLICDHLDDCLDIDNDQLCDNYDADGDGEVDDDCVGSYDQCGICNGDGTSCLINNACDLDNNNVYIYENSDNNNYELWYNVNFDIEILALSLLNNNIINIDGGAYLSSGSYQVGGPDPIVINGNPIPSGCGILFSFEVDGPVNDLTIDLLELYDDSGPISVEYCNSCLYEFIDPCDAYPTLTTNSISMLSDGTVIYNIDFNLNAFEWKIINTNTEISQTIYSISGGDSEEYGFDISETNNIIIGSSPNNPIIPGCGELLNLSLNEYNNIIFEGVINSEQIEFNNGQKSIDFIPNDDCQGVIDLCGVCNGNGLDADQDGVCDDIDDCIGDYDPCGVCNGNGLDDDLDGLCDDIDECVGSINEDGSCEQLGVFDSSTLPLNTITIDELGKIYYNVNFDIGGFQWDVEGTSATGASGGDAETAGFTVQAAGPTVLGFSFTGGFVPSGNGILTELTLLGIPTGLTGIVFSDKDGIEQTVNYYPIP